MASDLASLNNALETQAANEGISISLTNPNNQPITTTNPATIDIDPSNATGSGVTANSILSATSITSNVKTAMPGYSLTIQQAANTTTTSNTNIANPNGSLINPANPSNSPILSTDGTPDSPKALSNNEWGYAISGSNNFDTSYTTGNTNPLTSKWAKVPTSTETAQTIKTTEDTPPTEGDNTTVYYGVNVPKNKTAGQYQTTIIYTATANILDPPEVEKVSPETIGQGLSMVTGTVPSSYDMQPGSLFTCYISAVRGGVYCAIPESDYDAELSAIAPDGLITSGRSGWYEVNTSGMNGSVIQMVTGTAPSTYSDRPGNEYTCYVTDTGRVYCSVAWDGNDAELSAIAPDGLITSGRSGWYEVNTSGMNGSVIQMVTGTAPSTYSGWDNPDGRYACYLTSSGSVYCSVAGYDIDTKSIAPSLSGSVGGREWQQVNTTGFDGSVLYMSTGAVGSTYSGWENSDGNYTCYITIKGSVYCSIAGYDLDTSSIAPSVGSVSLSSGTWSKVNFEGMSERVVNMSGGKLGRRYTGGELGYYTCYSTQGAAVYCAVSGYEVDTSSIAPSGQISTSGQWRMIGYFKGTTAGTTITLTGKNLSKVTNVYIDTNNNSTLDEGTDISVSNLKITSDTQLTFTAPSMSAGTYNIIVVNPGNVVPGGTLTYR